ncbi:hypothetical protein BDP81DRAFT_443580, partial [Colletotrichum phormii]
CRSATRGAAGYCRTIPLSTSRLPVLWYIDMTLIRIFHLEESSHFLLYISSTYYLAL